MHEGHDHEHAHEDEHGHDHGHEHLPQSRVPQRSRGPLDRGAGSDKILFLDAFSGLSGDMIVGALLDLGVPREPIDRALAALPMGGYRIEMGSVVRSGIVARRFIVHVEKHGHERPYQEIRQMLEASSITEQTRAIALAAFARLAQAEANVHDLPIENVHFHEVGAVDCIVDIVAAAAAFEHLGAFVICSPLPMGRGMVAARHGTLPLPAPATIECLSVVPTYDAKINAELVTPTGACIVATVSREFSRWPSMLPERIGWAGGKKELADRPNLLRAVLGARATTQPTRSEDFVIVETNIDDMSPEIAAHAASRLFESGALDVWTTAIHMKKGRTGLLVAALARKEVGETIARALLAETSSLGVRLRPCSRIERPRRSEQVSTRFGEITVKIASGDGLPTHIAPEHESCKRAALAHGVPLKDVYAEALAIASAGSIKRSNA